MKGEICLCPKTVLMLLRYAKLGGIPKRSFLKIREQMTSLKNIRTKRKTKRRFSAKQLAAQRLFAKRARAGTLRRRR